MLRYAAARLTHPQLPRAFETVGHIAHYNLQEEHLPFKHQIGQILVEKHPLIKTVVNKTGEIASEFRVLPMELIYGEVLVSCPSFLLLCNFFVTVDFNRLPSKSGQDCHFYPNDFSVLFRIACSSQSVNSAGCKASVD